MADDAEAGGKAAKPRVSKKTLIIGGAAALAIVGGVGGYLAFAGGGEAKAKAEAHGESESGGHGDAKADPHGAPPAGKVAFLDLPELTVNLATADKERTQYVRLSVSLELEKQELADAIRPMMPRVLDAFQIHLRELRPSDIKGSAGVYRLKDELLRRVNVAVAPAKVSAVLFKDIVVQ